MRRFAPIVLLISTWQPLTGGLVSEVSCVLQGQAGPGLPSPVVVAEEATLANPGFCALTYSYNGETALVEGRGQFGFSTDLGAIAFVASFSGIALPTWLPYLPEPFYGVDGYSTTTASAQGVFATPGPVRPGILLVEAESELCSLDGAFANVSFLVAGQPGDFHINFCPGGGTPQHSWQFPVTLGVPFEYSLEFESDVRSSITWFGSQMIGHALVTVSTIDLLGQPVAISAVPEPSLGPIVAICVGALLARKRKRDPFG